jgi:hypothetical protein
MMNDWEHSLAAASLTMRPNNEKSWAGYRKVLEIVDDRTGFIIHGEGESILIMRSVLHAWDNDQANDSATRGKDALALKLKGMLHSR